MARAQATTDHEVIRHWIEAHKGHPSIVRATEGKRPDSAGLLRVDFEPAEESLEEISWDDFFDTFDSHNLAFLYQDEKQSRFHKFVSRDSLDESELEGETSRRGRSKSASAGTRGKSASKTQQASPAEEEEAEEIDAEDVEDMEDVEDIEEEDEKPPRGRKR